ncbi:MAG TPA: PDZ domain-containing protein, partial [Pyrinomonadaceae bacterium]
MIQLRQHDPASNTDADTDTDADAGTRHASTKYGRALGVAEATAFGGLLLYAVFAPHSIAGAWIALSISILGWLARALLMRRANFRHTPLDLPLWLFYAWSILSALLSPEPRISLLKLISVSAFLIYYLVRTLARPRRRAMAVAVLMIASGAAGALWSAFEVVRGRGVVIEEVAPDSPFARDASLGVAAGDSVWRVGGRRVNSVEEIDQAIKEATTGEPLKLSLFSQGEQAERVATERVSEELKARPSPSGLRGTRRAHRFRASGWTRHYQTFAETLQILAQLSLGFALAHWHRRRMRPLPRLRVALLGAAFLLLAAGIALTAMRTVLVAFAAGAVVVAWRASRGRARLVVSAVVMVALAL